MTDKERILMEIIRELDFTQLLAPKARSHNKEAFTEQYGSNPRTFAHFAHYKQPEEGDLVLCTTIDTCDWKIGWYVTSINYDEAMIREIGTNRLCRVYNEEFVPIVGMHKYQLLEGDEYVFRQKVIKAFKRGGEWLYRFGSVDFDKNNTRNATIWIREVFGGFDHENPSKPFPVHIHWNKKTTIKKILETMREQGYGKDRK